MRQTLQLLLSLWLAASSAPVHAASISAPSEANAIAVVEALLEAVASGGPSREQIRTWFTAGPDEVWTPGERADLVEAFAPYGRFGRLVDGGARVIGQVLGPDYRRVVLNTEPPFTVVVERSKGRDRIARWGASACGLCSEPERFVRDVQRDVLRGGRGAARLLPGLDLALDALDEEGRKPALSWRHAWTSRNLTAGYLRYLIRDAEVVGARERVVSVRLNGRVELWPVLYRSRRWQLDYSRLPSDSPLRLGPSETTTWRKNSTTRAAAVDWWTPLDRVFTDSGRLVATGAVGVGFDPLRERWLVLLQRLDGRVAGLFALDSDGEVVGRWAVPRWPYRAIVDYGKFGSSWTSTIAPRGHKVFLSAAGRLWTLDLESGRLREGESGRFDRLTTADWSADEKWIAIGDRQGRVGLLRADSLATEAVSWGAGGADQTPVAEVAFLPGTGRVVAAWENGGVMLLSVPDLKVADRFEGLCCDQISSLSVHVGRSKAMIGCGEPCTQASVVTLPLVGGAPPRVEAAQAFSGAGRVAIDTTGRLALLPYGGRWGRAALCDADSLTPLAYLSDRPLVQVAWGTDGRFMGLRDDGTVVLWDVEGLREVAAAGLPPAIEQHAIGDP